MPYPHREPVSESEMDRHRYDGHHSICQTLRDIYHITDNPDGKLKCRLAMAMAKAMTRKMQAYRDIVNEKDKQIVEGEEKFEDGL